MRVGVLTFHSSRNFGANLQTLATQEMLRKLGCEPVIVNYIDEPKLAAFEKLVPASQIAEHDAFANRYYALSPELTTTKSVAEYCRDCLDAVAVGSDAVFRLATPLHPIRLVKRLLGKKNPYEAFSWHDRLPPFFLPFEAPGLTKAAIAASARGTPFYFLRPSVMRGVGAALRDFDFVTVRDDWTGTMVRWLSMGRARPVYSPDPVFGLNRAFSVPDDEKPQRDLSNSILLTGSFSRAWLKRMIDAIHARGYKVATLANPAEKDSNDLVDFEIGLPMSPLRWYACLASCAGFVGMRFHAYVSCLSNGTPVVTMDVAHPRFGNKDRRNPNYDLARRAGITENYFVRRDLMRIDADDILARLFNSDTQRRANDFAAKAPDALFCHLGRIKALSASRR